MQRSRLTFKKIFSKAMELLDKNSELTHAFAAACYIELNELDEQYKLKQLKKVIIILILSLLLLYVYVLAVASDVIVSFLLYLFFLQRNARESSQADPAATAAPVASVDPAAVAAPVASVGPAAVAAPVASVDPAAVAAPVASVGPAAASSVIMKQEHHATISPSSAESVDIITLDCDDVEVNKNVHG